MLAGADEISAGSVGLVYLAAILPSLGVKLSAPYWCDTPRPRASALKPHIILRSHDRPWAQQSKNLLCQRQGGSPRVCACASSSPHPARGCLGVRLQPVGRCSGQAGTLNGCSSAVRSSGGEKVRSGRGAAARRFPAVTYPARMWACALFMTGAFTTVALGSTRDAQLVGVAMAAVQVLWRARMCPALARVLVVPNLAQAVQLLRSHLAMCGQSSPEDMGLHILAAAAVSTHFPAAATCQRSAASGVRAVGWNSRWYDRLVLQGLAATRGEKRKHAHTCARGNLQSGLGEASCLALTARYPSRAAITLWSSGTGFAGTQARVLRARSPLAGHPLALCPVELGMSSHSWTGVVLGFEGFNPKPAVFHSSVTLGQGPAAGVAGYSWVGGLHTLGGLSLRSTLLLANALAAGFLATYHLLLQPPGAPEPRTPPLGGLEAASGSRELGGITPDPAGGSPRGAAALGLEDRGGRRRREGLVGLDDPALGHAGEDAQRLLGSAGAQGGAGAAAL